MPVDTPLDCVAQLAPAWAKVRACAAGPRAIKAAGEMYLPKLKSHTNKPELYERYLRRALFLPVTQRTCAAYEGLVFAKEPEVEVPEDDLLEDVTLTGTSFFTFARETWREVAAPGRFGVLVDMAPEVDGATNPSRAYFSPYCAENITYWRTDSVADLAKRSAGVRSPEFAALALSDGSRVVTHLRLREFVDEPDPEDMWTTRKVEQMLVIDLMDVAGPSGITIGQVHQRYRKQKDRQGPDAWVPAGDPYVPKRRGVPVPFIPFVAINPLSVGMMPCEPPLLGLAEINLSQYMTSADLENARFKLGHPQLYAFGVTTQPGQELEIGDSLWTSTNADAKCGSVQVADQFEGLRLAMVEKQDQMLDEGARLMAKTERQETATAAKIRKAGERSMLALIGDNVGAGLTEALAYLAWWNDGVADLPDVRKTVSVRLNDTFEDEFMSGPDAKAWLEVRQGYGISSDTLTRLYHRAKVLPEGRTVEQELALIEIDKQREMDALAEEGGDDPLEDEEDA